MTVPEPLSAPTKDLLAEIEALITAGKVLSTRIVRTVINGRDTYRMQLVCDGRPTRRHPVGDDQVADERLVADYARVVLGVGGSGSGVPEFAQVAVAADVLDVLVLFEQLCELMPAIFPVSCVVFLSL